MSTAPGKLPYILGLDNGEIIMDILNNKPHSGNLSVQDDAPDGFHWAAFMNRLGLQGWTLHRDTDKQIVAGVERLEGGSWRPFQVRPDGSRYDRKELSGPGGGIKAREQISATVSAWSWVYRIRRYPDR